MLSKNFRLLFYLKKPKNYHKGKLPIYLRITIDAGRIELSTQRDCEPERWNSQSGRVNGSKEEIKSINVYLDSVQTKVYEAYRSLLDKNEPINVASIKNVLKGIAVKPRMVLDISLSQ